MKFDRGVVSRFFHIGLWSAALLLPLNSAVAGADDNAFYPDNTAISFFGDEVTESGTSNFRILNKTKKDKEPEVSPNVQIQDPQSQAAAQELPHAAAPVEKPGSAEVKAGADAVIAKFGDPEKDAEIPVQDNAPLPFKGMMAALKLGDDKLAFAYARQYARHMRNLDQHNKTAAGYLGLAFKEEGMLKEGSWVDGPQFDSIKARVGDEVDAGKTVNSSAAVDLSKLDPKTKSILTKAFEAEDEKALAGNTGLHPAAAKPKDGADIKSAREKARRSFVGRVPVDPKGEVEFYFFIRTTETRSQLMGREVQAFHEWVRDNPSITVRGLTVELEDEDAVARFKGSTGASYPIVNGSKLAQEIGIKNTPALVAVAKTTRKAYLEIGPRKQWFLDELANHMLGVKQ